MEKWIEDLKAKQKKEHENFNDNDSDNESDNEKLDEEGVGADAPVMGEEEEEIDGSDEDEEPPAKQVMLLRMLVDDHVVEAGTDLLLDCGAGRMLCSKSCLSRASSVVSLSSSGSIL